MDQFFTRWKIYNEPILSLRRVFEIVFVQKTWLRKVAPFAELCTIQNLLPKFPLRVETSWKVKEKLQSLV